MKQKGNKYETTQSRETITIQDITIPSMCEIETWIELLMERGIIGEDELKEKAYLFV